MRALASALDGPGWEAAGTRGDRPLCRKVGGRSAPPIWEVWVLLAWRLRGGAGDQRRPSGGRPGSPLLEVALGIQCSDPVTGWRETRWDAGGRSREVGSGLRVWTRGQPDSRRSPSRPRMLVPPSTPAPERCLTRDCGPSPLPWHSSIGGPLPLIVN